MSGPPFLDRANLSRRRVAVAVAGGVAVLALLETASALVAPLRAPTDEDWRAAATEVRAGFQPGDLIVAAPSWADQVLRLHLGDLIPVEVAARLDDARYGRVWEISQRGATAPEVRTQTVAHHRDHGALALRRYDRRAAVVIYDFLASWQSARVSRHHPGRDAIPCALAGDRIQCPELGFNFVRPQLLEVGTTLRRALLAQPVDGATVVIEYPDVPLGRELAVGSGLHHVWLRKGGDGQVLLRVSIDGQEIVREQVGNRSGWHLVRADTSRWDGKSATVRFEISADRAFSRFFGFAAEARR